MRRILQLSIPLVAAVVLLGIGRGYAGDKKPDKPGDAGPTRKVIEDELAASDSIDRITKRPAKVHKVKLAEGKTYRIDLESRDFDPILRLETAEGKQIAANDDASPGNLNSRIVRKITASGRFRLIATSYDGKPGKYTLTIREASPAELTVAKLGELAKLDGAEQREVLAQIKKMMVSQKADIDESLANTLITTAIGLEYNGDPELAREIYADFGKLLAGAADPNIAKAGRMMAGAMRRMKLIGNPIDVHGRTLEGKDFHWKQYKGKVVLIDFWAVWCGPCRQEIPNIIKMYEKYHERGFEVVGISLDNKTDAPIKYMEKAKMPWTCLHDASVGKDQPRLAEYYGVFGIPRAILVGRDGRVISTEARAELLQELLQTQFSQGQKETK